MENSRPRVVAEHGFWDQTAFHPLSSSGERYHPPLVGGDIEAQGCSGTCPRSHSPKVAKARFEPKSARLQVPIFLFIVLYCLAICCLSDTPPPSPPRLKTATTTGPDVSSLLLLGLCPCEQPGKKSVSPLSFPLSFPNDMCIPRFNTAAVVTSGGLEGHMPTISHSGSSGSCVEP